MRCTTWMEHASTAGSWKYSMRRETGKVSGHFVSKYMYTLHSHAVTVFKRSTSANEGQGVLQRGWTSPRPRVRTDTHFCVFSVTYFTLGGDTLALLSATGGGLAPTHGMYGVCSRTTFASNFWIFFICRSRSRSYSPKRGGSRRGKDRRSRSRSRTRSYSRSRSRSFSRSFSKSRSRSISPRRSRSRSPQARSVSPR